MARPKQDGLRYFSFDTDFFYADKRIKALKARYGCDGIVIYIYLLTEIYRNGYYIKWDEDAEDNMMADLNLTDGLIKQVMEYLVSRSLLTQISILDSPVTDANLATRSLQEVSTLANPVTIITSPGIQKRYQEAVKGLKRDVIVDPDIWLLSNEVTATYIKYANKNVISEKNQSKSEKNQSKSEKNDIKENKLKEIKRNKNTIGRFTPPSVSEVRAYCQSRSNGINPEEFVNFYESKGWMIGKNKMKDWKAAIRTWEQNRKKDSKSQFNQFMQQDYDFDAIEKDLAK